MLLGVHAVLALGDHVREHRLGIVRLHHHRDAPQRLTKVGERELAVAHRVRFIDDRQLREHEDKVELLERQRLVLSVRAARVVEDGTPLLEQHEPRVYAVLSE